MTTLGIGAITHDSGAAITEKGKIIHAVNEERFNRIKLSGGFPHLSMKYLLEKVKKENIDKIAVSDLGDTEFRKRSASLMTDPGLFSDNPYISAKSWLIMLRWKTRTQMMFKQQQQELRKRLGNKLIQVEHHEVHAASTYMCSGLKKVLIITCDNHGDFLTTTASIGHGSSLERIHAVKWPHSPGFFYAIVTKALGFKQWRHEGKITGLAAFGNPNAPFYETIKKLMWYENGTIKTSALLGSRGIVHRLAQKYSREDLAAVFQRVFEEVICDYTKYYMDKTGIKDIALAGGAFANVKLNERIKELGAKSVFVFPHMGDGGTAAGAALFVDMQEGALPYKLKDVYFGPSWNSKEIKQEIDKRNVSAQYHEDIESQVAELLAKGKVVARWNGAMEFGPRALGNRSILYQATDPSVNDWLNKRLKRTEFMPFAPVTLEQYAPKCYKNLKGAEYTAKFMTICFEATPYLKETCPAVVHVDNTARPQLITKSDNPSYYKILDEYRKITKLPSIVNTSFNMHEEPIVCSPEDAIRSFKQGHLNYLAMGDFLVKK